MTAIAWFLIILGIATTTFGITGQLIKYNSGNLIIRWFDFFWAPAIYLTPTLAGLLILELTR